LFLWINLWPNANPHRQIASPDRIASSGRQLGSPILIGSESVRSHRGAIMASA
jgi:hypothetical protein